LKNYNLFILGYNAAGFLDQFLKPSSFPNTNIKIIDNGQQLYTNHSPYYTTTKNLGCAGGWNLICSIGFDYLGLDKIIISNEDNRYTEEYIELLDSQCSPTNIAGTYNHSYEFSLFCIHKDTYNKIGKFDENFVNGLYEDSDYKQRCKLKGITVSGLGIDGGVLNNKQIGSRTITVENRRKNLNYLWKKWGLNFAFNRPTCNCLEFPSDSEYLKFRNIIY
jgi:hypothetical protein